MMRYNLRLGVNIRWEMIAQGFRNVFVESLPSPFEQALICSILDERVFEAVDRVRNLTAAKHKLCLL